MRPRPAQRCPPRRRPVPTGRRPRRRRPRPGPRRAEPLGRSGPAHVRADGGVRARQSRRCPRRPSPSAVSVCSSASCPDAEDRSAGTASVSMMLSGTANGSVGSTATAGSLLFSAAIAAPPADGRRHTRRRPTSGSVRTWDARCPRPGSCRRPGGVRRPRGGHKSSPVLNRALGPPTLRRRGPEPPCARPGVSARRAHRRVAHPVWLGRDRVHPLTPA